MMEGMNQAGQEEYIWAMRLSLYHESDSDLWKDRKRASVAARSHKSKGSAKSITSGDVIDDNQTRVMASLIPDEVITNVDNYNHRVLEGAILFGDVSGFTDLCEKYTQTGLSGPSRMTQVLNKYMGSMVQEIMSHGGDVLKFSGDAFLALFKTTEDNTIRDCVHEALDSALVIQKNYGSYLTDVGVVIRVKLAASAGLVSFALIGDENNSHYVVVGKPIWDVKAAEHISVAGDIVVAPAAWHYVNANEYISKDMTDGIHIKLQGVGPGWRSVQKNTKHNRQEKHEENVSVGTSSSSSDESDTVQDGNEEISLRPAVNLAVRLNIKSKIRKFIIAPVMKSIEMNEPFEYLTEMRQTVIVFINVVSRSLETRETVILADASYKIVCRVVDKMKGCVNKVSLFDKDLMFLVVFGLRGLKHELECQVALRCARECHEEINKLPGVLSTSIGITTGKTYCGVFGHTLRREYTVISLIVNKAARLMVAYKTKVTCDRETFLHSKLESRHFILQEFKPLKGISHPGPIYEFRETDPDWNQFHKFSRYPLLGRQEQMKLYESLLEKNTHQPNEKHYKMLVIRGNARQGKSRLLEEFVYVTPDDILINIFTLRPKDRKVPYHAIRHIFSAPLSLSPDSSIREKEMKILEVLRKLQVPDLLCVLNDVLGVNFTKTPTYMNLSEEGKKSALKKLIKQLCYNCFVTLWVIAIDNCDNIDSESWEILDALFDIKTIFIVATKNKSVLGLPEAATHVLADERVKCVDLVSIEKYYLAALACQVLGVYAISPELENAIQTKSNGNPGWIESFLISMIQDKELFILNATLRDVNDMGLVSPPVYMMQRLSEEETRKWQMIMEERKKTGDSTIEHAKWQKYIDTCRDSYLNVKIRELLEDISTGGRVRICIATANFRVRDEEAELSMDALILKTFDSLNFYEQLLAKCSAVLGNQFFRDMLLYVVGAKDKRQVALAVKKLFEIRVITCAKGDFFDDMPSHKDKLTDPNEDQEVTCRCRGLMIEETCRDLPRYASCGLMQFKSSAFREITYSLLTDNQKKEFHQRAIRYLERETRKCRSCGNGFFDNILGRKVDRDLLSFKDTKKKNTLSVNSSFETSSMRRSSGQSSFSSGSASATTTGSKKKFDEKSVVSFGTLSPDIKDSKTKNVWFGISIINKLKNSFSLTRAFSSEDFTDCNCKLILSTTYAQLIEHCTGSGDLSKLLDVMVEYAYISILLCNIPLALKILDEALEVLKDSAKSKVDHTWKTAMIRGKIFTLIGYARLELGHFKSAYRNLHKGLTNYGVKFPTGIGRGFKRCSQKTKHAFAFYIFPKSMFKRLSHWETVYTNNLAECLTHLCTLYMIRDEWVNAEVAAGWALNKVLAAFSDFEIISTAFANMLYVAQYFQRWNLCLALEIHGLRICQHKRSSVIAEDLKGVAKFYGVIFCLRLMRANMEKAIHIGYITLRIAASVKATQIILPLLPLLIHALLSGGHFNNAQSVLQELEFFANEDLDNSGKVWYLALCMVLQLETGYSVIPYIHCLNVYHMEGESWITIRDPDARKRYFTVMWLWCVRNEKWEEATLWCLQTDEFSIITETDSLVNKITALYLLEGMLLFLVWKLDKRNAEAIAKAESEIKCLINVLERSSESSKFILPRLLHLKAYFKFIKSCDVNVSLILKDARKCADKCSNDLELSWIEHSTKAWTRCLPAISIDFWKEHCDPENLLDFAEIEVSATKLAHFTLPTPLYL